MSGSIFHIALWEIACCTASVFLGCAVMILLSERWACAGRWVENGSSGFLLSLVCFFLLPKAFAVLGFWSVFFWMLSGTLSMLLLEEWAGDERVRYFYFCVVTLVVSLGKGLSIGSGFFAAASKGSAAMGITALLHFLFGISIGSAQTDGKKKSLIGVLLCTVSLLVGLFVGGQVGFLLHSAVMTVFSFWSGGVVYGGLRLAEKRYARAMMIGFLAGLIVVFL